MRRRQQSSNCEARNDEAPRHNPVAASIERTVDLLVATLSIPPALAVVTLAALLLRFDGPGPALLRQRRVGRHGRPFGLFKLRTMRGAADATVAASASDRIGPVGRLVRRAKIDELPQLVNVLRGEMALVGPRPELPHFARLLSDDQAALQSVRPGLVDRVSLSLADEDRLLASCSDPQRAYQEVLLPLKAAAARRDVLAGALGRWRAALAALPCLVSSRRRIRSPLRREIAARLRVLEAEGSTPAADCPTGNGAVRESEDGRLLDSRRLAS